MPDKESWVNILLMHIFLFTPPSAVTVHLVHVSIKHHLVKQGLLSKWENNVNQSLSVISVTVRYVSVLGDLICFYSYLFIHVFFTFS